MSKIDRHCAFCLNFIPANKVRMCSKCHKRAYCSPKCQAKDWKLKNVEEGAGSRPGVGQGHKSWCGLPYGEEDLDWSVAIVPAKGLGLIAKRFMPAKTRIMVDGFRTSDIFSDPRTSCKSLGRSRVANHDCGSNAAKMIDPDFKTMIIYAKRCIQPGEEICVNYVCYDEVYTAQSYLAGQGKILETFQDAREMLSSTWNIVCPSDCFCWNAVVDNLIARGRNMRACIVGGGKRYTKIDAKIDLEIIGDLLVTWERVQGSWIQKAQILEIGFEVGVQRKRTMKLAAAFIKEAHEIWSGIVHPRGRFAMKAEKFMKNPKDSEKYLCLK